MSCSHVVECWPHYTGQISGRRREAPWRNGDIGGEQGDQGSNCGGNRLHGSGIAAPAVRASTGGADCDYLPLAGWDCGSRAVSQPARSLRPGLLRAGYRGPGGLRPGVLRHTPRCCPGPGTGTGATRCARDRPIGGFPPARYPRLGALVRSGARGAGVGRSGRLRFAGSHPRGDCLGAADSLPRVLPDRDPAGLDSTTGERCGGSAAVDCQRRQRCQRRRSSRQDRTVAGRE